MSDVECPECDRPIYIGQMIAGGDDLPWVHLYHREGG